MIKLQGKKKRKRNNESETTKAQTKQTNKLKPIHRRNDIPDILRTQSIYLTPSTKKKEYDDYNYNLNVKTNKQKNKLKREGRRIHRRNDSLDMLSIRHKKST